MHKNAKFKIVLNEPQIPQNTGNIIRLCSCTGSSLYITGKPGFHLSDKYMKRAGLDYSHDVKIETVSSLPELEKNFPDNNFYYFSTKASKKYSEIQFKSGDFLVFGSETKGLPEDLIYSNPDKSHTIPMLQGKRSLNLSNSVSIVLYEGLRQNNFFNLL